ncbi:MAG: primosomal protein N' [Deferribacteraceae bacterium]|jgi:primosomal protein N' (replication factor Y)|nr:primosomal protein N' [Deferribacteraceae bacterium]
MNFFNILLPIAAEGIFTYSSDNHALPGTRVAVSFNNRKIVGIVLGETKEPPFKCKEISIILDEIPLFDKQWLEFIRKISEYYLTPLGSTLFGVLSPRVLASSPPKRPCLPKPLSIVDVDLSAEQKAIAERISADMSSFYPHLIHGVTGSGKTEIYMELIKRVAAIGRQTLYLVPEISLTPQLFELLSARLGIAPSVFHSKLPHKARADAFWQFALGETPFIVGARSALFIPSEKLGMIILDEEHEKSYKQEETPSYHLRDMAVLYAKIKKIPIILGSATPQVESYFNAANGKYSFHTLPNRIFGASMPTFNIIDIKKEYTKKIMAEPLLQELTETVSRGEQAIIFLNRKGYSTSLYCKVCGALQYCPNCSVPYTVYRSGRLLCNYCGSSARYSGCSVCGSTETYCAGVGTERVEEYLEERFPNQIVRIDADSVRSAGRLTRLIADFGSKKAQILVGTQFIAKGLHFPDVTFVGILGIDNILSLPDFRASERGYQLITQISGRAGRGKKCGIIHIQTMMPNHPLLNTEIYGGQNAFYDYELPRRAMFKYPPYTKLSRFLFAGGDERVTEEVSERVVYNIKKEFPKVIVLGPAKAPISKMNNLYRYAALIKSNSNKNIAELIKRAAAIFEKEKTAGIIFRADRDPYYFM